MATATQPPASFQSSTSVTAAPTQNTHQLNAFIRGCISGVLVVAVLQPFDVIKTVQQVSNSKSITNSLKLVVKQDGIQGLWTRGLGPTLMRGALGPGTYFQALELTDKWFPVKTKSTDFIQGALARAIGAVVVSPFSVLKARIEWNPKSGIKFNGVKDMFVGLAPTLARDVPFSGLYMVFYKFFKTGLEDRVGNSGLERFGLDFGAGLTAGFVATAITHPFDVIKTRSQIGVPLFGGNLWTGLSLRLAKRPLSMALTWACFEVVSRKDLTQVAVKDDKL